MLSPRTPSDCHQQSPGIIDSSRLARNPSTTANHKLPPIPKCSVLPKPSTPPESSVPPTPHHHQAASPSPTYKRQKKGKSSSPNKHQQTPKQSSTPNKRSRRNPNAPQVVRQKPVRPKRRTARGHWEPHHLTLQTTWPLGHKPKSVPRERSNGKQPSEGWRNWIRIAEGRRRGKEKEREMQRGRERERKVERKRGLGEEGEDGTSPRPGGGGGDKV